MATLLILMGLGGIAIYAIFWWLDRREKAAQKKRDDEYRAACERSAARPDFLGRNFGGGSYTQVNRRQPFIRTPPRPRQPSGVYPDGYPNPNVTTWPYTGGSDPTPAPFRGGGGGFDGGGASASWSPSSSSSPSSDSCSSSSSSSSSSSDSGSSSSSCSTD